ncbi:MAG: competence/damage-inducible protein A [Bacillota bacterium]
MQADIICVGNELLTGLIENSNAGYLSRRLWSAGIPVREVRVVADDEKAIGEALEKALEESDLVILTGGLGPTDDDLTREAVAAILGLELILNQQWFEKMDQFFSVRGIKMPENNRKQALEIKGSTLLENKRGTAPGAILNKDGKFIILLPGPPHELQNMFDNQVLPYLVEKNRGRLTTVKTLKCIGLGESMLEEKIKAIGKWDLPPISYVARGYEVDLQIKGSGDLESASVFIDEAEKRLRDVLGDHIYGSNDDTLADIVAKLLTEKKLTLSLAESCSGGLLSDTITDIPGSSKFYRGAVIAYSNEAKIKALGLNSELLTREGEVSDAVARAMAEGAKSFLKTDLGVGITGIAGPDSDLSGSPVGLVYIAVAAPKFLESRKFNLGGGRRAIKERAVQVALDLVRKVLINN